MPALCESPNDKNLFLQLPNDNENIGIPKTLGVVFLMGGFDLFRIAFVTNSPYYGWSERKKINAK
ncbi:hypothetical protein D1B33_02040 [Lysinibacillus yapensis]|uniref:Uncharacterized protein n=1 Tax=Ureibacillus yapensis TaxID=2304605 RepID=A0A396SD97_9BACL|nr:hypothetical protein D1B33_02040 [Lysinibacillus yapensis]